jgi:hypothetical protein
VVLIFLGFAIRARRLFFFANVNPAIPLGGAFGESKSAILSLLPIQLTGGWVVLERGVSAEVVEAEMEAAGLVFPVVVKPDIGERGLLVKRVESLDDLMRHLQLFPLRFILQEWLAEPIECTLSYHWFSAGDFQITSVCEKGFLAVEGDGISSVEQLMQRKSRAAFQINRLRRESPALMMSVPARGEQVLLEPIGNHVRGTAFLNRCNRINEALLEVFEPVCRAVGGVHCGRFDIKCDSWEALQQGKFRILELNGVLGEPAHIYDPAYGFVRAYRDLYRHWRVLYQLHRVQQQKGVAPPSLKVGLQLCGNYFAYKRRVRRLKRGANKKA